MGGPDPKTYPSKPSETHITFLKYALSRPRICESQLALKHCFWPKNALFCTKTASEGGKGGQKWCFLYSDKLQRTLGHESDPF